MQMGGHSLISRFTAFDTAAFIAFLTNFICSVPLFVRLDMFKNSNIVA